MNRIRRFLAAFVVFAFSPCFLIFSVAEDRVITSAELQQVSQHNFWYALSVLEPSFALTDRAYHGDVPGYIPEETAVRGFTRWTSRAKSRNILFLIDGNRVPLNVARALNVSDIREIRVITDAVNLAVWLKFKPCAPRQYRFKYHIVPSLHCFRPTKARTRRSKKT